jgi:UTP--glucose-1-phosphate uridylyltransferase
MVRNIIPEGVECIFVRQAEQLGLGHAVMCAERVVGGDPFAVLLADDFLTDYAPGVTADLAQAFTDSGKSQLSVMEVNGPDIFETLRGLGAGSGGEIQLADAINIHAGRGAVETVRLNGMRFDCGSVDGFMRASQHEYQRRQSH